MSEQSKTMTAIMGRIATPFILFIAVQTVAAHFLPLDLDLSARTVDDTDAKCAKLSAALDAFWDSIPDTVTETNPQARLAKDTLDRRMKTLLGDIPFSWSTAESRREIACTLAGVHTLSDLKEILPNKGQQFYHAFVQELHQHPQIVRLFRETGNFIDLLKYLMRITGFPTFPLDLYDMDMARYVVGRMMKFYSAHIPDRFVEQAKQRWVNAAMSDTMEDFLDTMGYDREGWNMKFDFFRTYADTYQSMSNLFVIIEDMGLFNLQ